MRLAHRFAAMAWMAFVGMALTGCGGSGDAVPASISGGEGSAEAAADLSDPARYDVPAGTAEDDDAASRNTDARRQADLYPVVQFKTSLGEFKLKLDRQRAPSTVENFLAYVTSGFYDGTIMHQVEDGFIVAGGGYTPDLKAKPTRTPIRNEAHNGLKNRRGTVAMVRLGSVHSATSQFLLNLADNPSLDHKSRDVPEDGQPDEYGYCAFGEVVAGMDVVTQISQVKVRATDQFSALPVKPIVIESARRLD